MTRRWTVLRCFVAVFLVLPVSLTPLRAQVIAPPPLHLDGTDALFNDAVVHDIYLRVNETDWQTLKARYLDNTYYPADVAIDDVIVRNVGIKSRGSGSRSGTKPGLKIDFSQYVSGQQLFSLKALVLRNNTQDPSNLRERLSMLLYARLGLPAPREVFARFWVNKKYAGLYTIVEPLDKSFLQRVFGESDGYLYSYDYPNNAAPFYFENRGSDPSLYVPTPFSPETRSSDPQPEVIARWIDAINESSDAAFRDAIAPYVDLPAFVRFVAIEAFLADDDGVLGNWGMNNFYSYRRQDQSRFTLLPWDKSDAFIVGPDASVWHNIADVPPAQQNRLMMRALALPDVRAAFVTALRDCVATTTAPDPATPGAPGWLESEILREYGQIRSLALADTVKPFTNDQFEQSVQSLIDFARRRAAYVLGSLSGSAPTE
jgi:spore coat protein CotH